MRARIAVNGFGRIGRNLLRAIRRDGAALDVVGINDLADAPTLAHLLKYDSTHGRYPGDVVGEPGAIAVDGVEIPVFSERDPAELPWADLGVDMVVEATGVFRTRELAAKHLTAGARKVVITAPATEPDVTLCMGINHDDYDADRHDVVSNASCTTNCLAPVAKVLHEELTIHKGWMTTIHAVTGDQRILDLPHKDLRRARTAMTSMIPTTTGAARAVGLVLPELAGKIDGCAVRVPTPNVSMVNFVCSVDRVASAAEINDLFRAAAAGPLLGVLGVSDEPLVSIDYNGNALSSVVDAGFTRVVDGDLVQIITWYDNEMGYSSRVKDLLEYMATRQ
jgi:glyceraldehyde 3-phosphate dehydrogenase